MGRMRRKAGTLVPLELDICEAAAALRSRGIDQFHGYQIARTIGDAANVRLLTAYGTLYRALARLEKMGLLRSRWEDPAIPARENRPGRRLYTLTALGGAALEEARRASEAASRPRGRRRLAPA
jgi:DNA-binding PadR family transcriptional regulator